MQYTVKDAYLAQFGFDCPAEKAIVDDQWIDDMAQQWGNTREEILEGLEPVKNIITLYKVNVYQAYMMDEQGEGWSLEPWSGDNIDYKGETTEQAEFIFPEGIHKAKSASQSIELYDKNDNHVVLVTENGNPAIVTSDGITYLKKVR